MLSKGIKYYLLTFLLIVLSAQLNLDGIHFFAWNLALCFILFEKWMVLPQLLLTFLLWSSLSFENVFFILQLLLIVSQSLFYIFFIEKKVQWRAIQVSLFNLVIYVSFYEFINQFFISHGYEFYNEMYVNDFYSEMFRVLYLTLLNLVVFALFCYSLSKLDFFLHRFKFFHKVRRSLFSFEGNFGKIKESRKPFNLR